MNSIRTGSALRFRCMAAAVAAASAGVAVADVSQYAFVLTATSAKGTASYELAFPAGVDYENYEWELGKEVPLISPTSGETIATLKAAHGLIQADPAIGLGFAVQAGPADTVFTITSSLLSFPSVNPAVGRASAQVGVTDFDGDGVLLTGNHPSGATYRAQYNGFIPGGTDFANLVSSVSAGSFEVNGVSEDFPGGGGYAAIAGAVTNMSSEFQFTLSANDLANGTSFFEIIPEPATLTLLVAGVLVVRRRGA